MELDASDPVEAALIEAAVFHRIQKRELEDYQDSKHEDILPK